MTTRRHKWVSVAANVDICRNCGTGCRQVVRGSTLVPTYFCVDRQGTQSQFAPDCAPGFRTVAYLRKHAAALSAALLDQQRPPVTRARNDDPETSHAAAEEISDHLRELQQRVLTLFAEQGPMTHHELIAKYRDAFGKTSESTIRTRCAELVEKGLIVDTGARADLESGRRAVVWALTQERSATA